MHRIDTPDAVDHQFADGNPQTGQLGTLVPADWLNDLQENLCVAIEDAGLTLSKGNSGQLAAAIAAIAASVAPPVPSGAVFHFAASAAPSGYLACNGAAVSRATYAALFAAVGITYGEGDGSTTFNLPDLRGEFIRGVDGGRGVDAGRTIGSSQADALKSHQHTLGGWTAAQYGYDGGDYGTHAGPNATNVTDFTGGAETRPRNVALLACIKI